MTTKLSNLESISDFNQNFLRAVPWLKPDWSGLEREREREERNRDYGPTNFSGESGCEGEQNNGTVAERESGAQTASPTPRTGEGKRDSMAGVR